MDEEEIEIQEEMEDLAEDQLEDDTLTRADINADIANEYGSPMPEEKINQFKITSDAIKSKDSLKTTFLSKPELGKPLFSVRFYLDCAAISKVYNSDLIERYFKNKIQNIAGSGMSNEGFIMKLNVTNRRDVTRRRENRSPEDAKSP